jgi:phage FluMu protein Com
MRKIICKISGHKYKLLRKISNTIVEVKCDRCKNEFGMNSDAQTILPLDGELKTLHSFLLHEKHVM